MSRKLETLARVWDRASAVPSPRAAAGLLCLNYLASRAVAARGVVSATPADFEADRGSATRANLGGETAWAVRGAAP